jgi:hypothetical protein
VLPLFFCFTMDTATEFLFGESVGALDAVERAKGGLGMGDGDSYGGELAASSRFQDAIRVANDGTLLRIRLQRFYWLGDGFGFRSSIRIIKGFVKGFVEKALARVEAEGKAVAGKEKYGLLEALAAQTKDPEDLVSQTLGE